MQDGIEKQRVILFDGVCNLCNALTEDLDSTQLETRLLELKGKSQPVKVFVLNENYAIS